MQNPTSRKTQRPRRQNRSHLRTDQDRTFKPLDGQPHDPSQESDLNRHLPLPSTSQQQNTDDSQIPNSHFKPKSSRNLGRRHWVSKNQKFVKKNDPSELKIESLGLGSEEEREKELRDGKEAVKENENNEVGREEVSEKGLESDGGSEEEEVEIDEVELDEETIKVNDQLQEDELLALEAIYGEKAFRLDRKRGLRSFQIHIDVENAGELMLTANLNASGDIGMKSGKSEDFSYSFIVQHLPPIVFTCLLPKSYPSHLPPSFTISIQWLRLISISKLCQMLDSLWAEQPGQEVIYRWAEWLQSSSLSYLGFVGGIMLGPYGTDVDVDKRAISRSISPDVDIPSIRSYNEGKCHESFLKDIHECCICFSEFPGTAFIKLPCHHFFCRNCMKTYTDIHVKEGTISKLQCPDSKCGGMVPPGILKRLLGDEEYERWESLMLQKTLEAMTDVAYCPRCETPCIEDEDQHAQCSKCYFSFCTLCRDRRHVGIACMAPEMKLRILEERQKSSNLKEGQKLREREMINELLSVKEILRDAKQCPSCKMAISRTEGCNKMVCSNCDQYFCYLCNKAIDGYDHFRDGTCELFPQVEIQNWEERMNLRQQMGLQAVIVADHGVSCPNCRQFNAKIDNNNHMFCWACQMHYCYLCKKIVRRSAQHYGPKGCKQHSAD